MISKKIIVLVLISILISCTSEKKENDFLRLPMVGLILNNEVPILVKTISDGKVRVEYKKSDDKSTSFTDWKKVNAENGFSTSLVLKNVDYNSEYKYRVEFDNNKYSKWFSFKTFPEEGKPGKFSVVFSSGMRESYTKPYVYSNIKKMSPTFVALMGDQMYGDYDGNLNKLEEYLANDSLSKAKIKEGKTILKEKSVLDAFRGKYNRSFVKAFQDMSSTIPIMGIWDDHDMGRDNNDGTYRYKEIARKVFMETYPHYPFELEEGGIYYRFSIADVDCFVLDTRWYRSPMQNPDGPDKIMLGEKQLTWFLNGLKNSNARIKIIFSSIPFNDYGGDTSSGRPGYDSWMGYKYARSRILSFIKKNNIKGVVALTADQHWPSAHILNWEPPIKYISKTDKSIVFSLSELHNAMFDFSAGPFNYKRATGEPLIPENQKNPKFSYEVFRSDWSKPENYDKYKPYKGTSVFGLAEFDTESSPATITVKFYEMDKKTKEMVELYKITLVE